MTTVRASQQPATESAESAGSPFYIDGSGGKRTAAEYQQQPATESQSRLVSVDSGTGELTWGRAATESTSEDVDQTWRRR